MQKLVERYAKILAVVWLVFITALFFLPGSALPKEKFLDRLFFDKWVHFGFFTLLIFLWRFYFSADLSNGWWLLFIAFFYGFGVELIQHFFVSNRSFDLGDVIADMLGATAGNWLWSRRYIKK